MRAGSCRARAIGPKTVPRDRHGSERSASSAERIPVAPDQGRGAGDRVPLNGVKLQGQISSFDDFCISLEHAGQLQAVYKQEISTISTSAPLTLWDDPNAPAPRRPAARKAPAKKVVVERRRIVRSRA